MNRKREQIRMWEIPLREKTMGANHGTARYRARMEGRLCPPGTAAAELSTRKRQPEHPFASETGRLQKNRIDHSWCTVTETTAICAAGSSLVGQTADARKLPPAARARLTDAGPRANYCRNRRRAVDSMRAMIANTQTTNRATSRAPTPSTRCKSSAARPQHAVVR